MDVSNITFTSSANQSSSTTASSTLDKDAFLKLLVKKLSNQDPLNPQDDNAFIAELAQFSSLEQLENMNTSLTKDLQWNALLSQTINNTSAASLIGRSVRADSSELYKGTSGSADVAYNLNSDAATVTVDIKDSNGKVVRSIKLNDVAAGDQTVTWDGTNDDGDQVDAGYYTVSITAKDVNGNSVTTKQSMEGKITGVAYEDGSALLEVNGMQIPLSSVQKVWEG